METFALATLLDQHKESGKLYHEFLRVPSMNAGIYVLPANSEDPQQPHNQDEMYYVISGRATFVCEGHADSPAIPGQTIYVEKGIPHRFTNIEEDLTILVIFAG
jgi:mannose-6-phosphate isomerase-like protein (cupin superfamily)